MAMMAGRVSSTNGAGHGPLTFPTTPGPVLPPTGSDVSELLELRNLSDICETVYPALSGNILFRIYSVRTQYCVSGCH